MSVPGYKLSDEDVEAFREDGVVCLRGVFHAEAVEEIRTAVDAAMAHPGPHALDFSADGSGRFFGDLFVWTRIPALRYLVVESGLGEIAGRLLGAERIQFFFDHLLVKEPGAVEPTPRHQDAPYFPIEGGDCCTIWIALDPVTRENGAVEYLRGSHKSGKHYAPESFHGDGRLKNELLENLPDIEGERDRHDVVSWDMAPGDATVHHVRTIHGAPGNITAATRRRGLATRWISDDITFGMRPGIPEPMTMSLNDVAPGLVLGEPFAHPIFPEVWHRAPVGTTTDG